MGAVFSSDSTKEGKRAKMRSTQIQKTIQSHTEKEEGILKLLLLGAGQSGKSTLLKQIVHLHGDGFDPSELESKRKIVRENALSCIFALYFEEKHPERKCGMAKTGRELKVDVEGRHEVDEAATKLLKIVWEDEGIQKTYQFRNEFQLLDSAAYWMTRLDEIGKESYIPTFEDFLRTRVKTTGIVETPFKMQGKPYVLLDVGGQRSERKKWIHCFSNVTAVIFVVALSGYCQQLIEDSTTNRMLEALDLFKDIINNPTFKETQMILFLNKRDLFEERLKSIPLSYCFKDMDTTATNPQDYKQCVEFVKKQFLSKNESPDRAIYTHETCAMDTDQIKVVFNAVRDIVINDALKAGGVLEGY